MQISSTNLDAILHFVWLSSITSLHYEESWSQACNMQAPCCRKVIKQLQLISNLDLEQKRHYAASVNNVKDLGLTLFSWLLAALTMVTSLSTLSCQHCSVPTHSFPACLSTFLCSLLHSFYQSWTFLVPIPPTIFSIISLPLAAEHLAF